MIEGMDLITSENVKIIFERDKGKYSSTGNLERYRRLVISRGIDPKHGVLSVSQKSNEEYCTPSGGSSRSSSNSSSSSGSSSTTSLSSSLSSAISSDGSNLMPECAARKMCRAPTELQPANSSHHCWGCNKKIYSALQCGSSVSDLIFRIPSVVSMSLNNGNIIEEGDDNETRAICFVCLDPLSIFFTGSKHGEPNPKLAEEQLRTKKH